VTQINSRRQVPLHGVRNYYCVGRRVRRQPASRGLGRSGRVAYVFFARRRRALARIVRGVAGNRRLICVRRVHGV